MPNPDVRKGRKGARDRANEEEFDDLWYCAHCNLRLVSDGQVFGCHSCGRVHDVDVNVTEETREVREAPTVRDGKPVAGRTRREVVRVQRVAPKGAV